MNTKISRLYKAVVLLALGGTTFTVVTGGGCANAVLGDFALGFGNGVIAAGTERATAGLSATTQAFVVPPIRDALQTAWGEFTGYTFPVLWVRQEIFQN